MATDLFRRRLARALALAAVLPHTARTFARAIVMPNLKPPVTTVSAAAARKEPVNELLADSTGKTVDEPVLMAALGSMRATTGIGIKRGQQTAGQSRIRIEMISHDGPVHSFAPPLTDTMPARV